jgi:DNA-binding IclR family transcriptional regulator
MGVRDTGGEPARRAGTITRLVAVLGVLADRPQGTGLSELAGRAGLAKSTVHRMLGEMEATGLVRRHADLYWRASASGGPAGPGALRLREAVLPYMLELYEATHHTVHLHIQCGADLVCVDRLAGRARVGPPVGGRSGVAESAAGRVLLAHAEPAVRRAVLSDLPPQRRAAQFSVLLDRIRLRGFAVEDGVSRPGVGGAAAPVLRPDGQAVAALSVTAPATSLDLRAVVARVRRAAAAAGAAVGEETATG